jgi:inner membrane protein
MPLLVPVVIALLDAVARSQAWSVPVTGLLDEPAHLATAWLALCALTPRQAPPWLWRSALVASVAIDVDHVPLYLTGGWFAVGDGRPPTHSFALILVLMATGLLGQRARWALGAATGVLLHLVRDLATGPGVAVLWPISDTAIRVPYRYYVGLVVLLAAAACARGFLPRLPAGGSGTGPKPGTGARSS